MPSADHGAPPCARPTSSAGSPTWASSPLERADRDGIASWDLVLDGRRRFDLRVTVILDPALRVIVWAHYAPPISDMFRKSYRKLLRWNDEFPFAKFCVGEDERPLLAVELPIERRRRRSAGPGARPDPRHRRPAPRRVDGLALDRRPRRRTERRGTPRNPDFLDRYASRAAASSSRPTMQPRPRRRRPRPSSLLALVARSGLLGGPLAPAPARRGPRGHAGPDDRRATPATTSSPTSTASG